MGDITQSTDFQEIGKVFFPVVQVVEIADELKDLDGFSTADICEQISKKPWSTEFKMYMAIMATDFKEFFATPKSEILRIALNRR